MFEKNELPSLERFESSVYDIPLSSLDGEPNVLAKNKGKVTMIVNVTGECANSAQYPIIENLYKEYKDLGFEVLAVPSTDFCEDAYGAFKESNASPQHMHDHMKELYKTDLPFSELAGIAPEPKAGIEQHAFYKLIQDGKDPIQGNFEKILIGRDGKKMFRFCNSDLLDLAFNAGERKTNAEQALINIKAAIEVLLDDTI
jgi:glutathione peroxidase